jgi:hypothetical protein
MNLNPSSNYDTNAEVNPKNSNVLSKENGQSFLEMMESEYRIINTWN